MGKETGIAWTDHTFNAWWGCVKVSPACKPCYAAAFAKRVGQNVWGPESPRRFFGDKHWAEPLEWNRQAQKAGRTDLVFCSSMADVFEDRADLIPHRERLFDTIEQTPALDWQLLTKRPENVREMVPSRWRDQFPRNVWLGATVETADYYWRIRQLEVLPAEVKFLSCEPLLSAMPNIPLQRIDWVVIGGMSGPGWQQMPLAWLEDLVEQAHLAMCAVFVKQDSGPKPGQQGRIPDDIWALKEFPLV